ncbi:LOW QUALITY PROTEIN: hypothetical protein ElyMa_006940300 [Elysia marginata]|uniref:Uncharacterized protein n=1 Tax=Elysia marginata TaxID=1093978 RepID=A0AAV4JM60_9GAST|nr:LOW QUALITY PROTEIN: hypothetical protein ElyMa_006940300 [Elysia marginata]
MPPINLNGRESFDIITYYFARNPWLTICSYCTIHASLHFITMLFSSSLVVVVEVVVVVIVVVVPIVLFMPLFISLQCFSVVV